ncbi:TPA: hypothetical protein RG737_003530 [Morganella morganii subsp. morganii]|nr:hypothetical protein [Morganella morganii subsp. morganii]
MNGSCAKNIITRYVGLLSDLISPAYERKSIDETQVAWTPEKLNLVLADIVAKSLGYSGGSKLNHYLKFSSEKDHSSLIAKLKSVKFVESVKGSIESLFDIETHHTLDILYFLNEMLTFSVNLHPSGNHTLMCKRESEPLPFDIISPVFSGNSDEHLFYSALLRLNHLLIDIGSDVKLNSVRLPHDFKGVILHMDNDELYLIRLWIHRRFSKDADIEARKAINEALRNLLILNDMIINEKKFGLNIIDNLIFSTYSGTIVIPKYYFLPSRIDGMTLHNL